MDQVQVQTFSLVIIVLALQFSKSMVVECYSGYINNFTNATDLVHKTCLRKPQFLSFLQERQYESLNQLDVYGLMLKPVQRFPQFIMLVQVIFLNIGFNEL